MMMMMMIMMNNHKIFLALGFIGLHSNTHNLQYTEFDVSKNANRHIQFMYDIPVWLKSTTCSSLVKLCVNFVII